VTFKICAVVTGKTLQETGRMIKKAEAAKADLIEIRMDYLQGSYDASKIRESTNLPLIATNRPTWEGGTFNGPENDRINMLLSAADAGFNFVDLELSTGNLRDVVKDVGRRGLETIVSSHDYTCTPPISEIYRIFLRELRVGAEICKIITTAKTLDDNLTCLRFLGKASRRGKVVSFCMGELGVTSRILAPIFGASFTYASVQRGRESAPGQLTVETIRNIYRLME